MVLVKEEYDSESDSFNGDKWLSFWANSEEEIIKEEEVESKDTIAEIKDNILEKDAVEKQTKNEEMEVVEHRTRLARSKIIQEHNKERKGSADTRNEELKKTKTSQGEIKR